MKRKNVKRILTMMLAAVLSVLIASAVLADYSKEVIVQVQQALNEEGYDCGTPDGVPGKRTKKAIKKYQKKHDLEVDGKISDALLESLGISAVEEEVFNPENLPVAEPYSEDLYAGKWVAFGDRDEPYGERYEIYLPQEMDAAPIYDFMEAYTRHASLLYGTYMMDAAQGTGILIGTVEQRLGSSFIEEKEISEEEIAQYESSIQAEEGVQKILINGIPGYYYEKPGWNGEPTANFVSIDPEYDLVVHTFDIMDGGFWGQSSEQGAERCKNIILSLRVKEAQESESSTEAAE